MIVGDASLPMTSGSSNFKSTLVTGRCGDERYYNDLKDFNNLIRIPKTLTEIALVTLLHLPFISMAMIKTSSHLSGRMSFDISQFCRA